MRITDLLHHRWRSEPGVLLQDCFGEVFFQPGEVAVPHVCQILAVVVAQWLIPHYEAFNEPGTSTNNPRWLHCSEPGHGRDSPLDDLDGPCPLLSLLSGRQSSPAVFDLRGYFRVGKLGEAISNLPFYQLTSLSLSLVVSFHSVALVLGLDPCCCNRDSFELGCSCSRGSVAMTTEEGLT